MDELLKQRIIQAARNEAAYELWSDGDLDYILHDDLQTRCHRFTCNWKESHPNSALPIIWDMHRASGKTFMLCLMCAERGMRYPGQEIRFGAETEGKCEQIVEPNFRKIFQEFMPEGFIAEYRKDKASPYYELWNPTWPEGSYPSRIWIIGCRERADIHRGKRSHMVVLDECREIDEFEYVAKVVFGPHFATMENPVYIMSSTPPESMDHAWSRIYRTQAMEEGRYFCGPSRDHNGYEGNKDWSEEDDQRMLEVFRSKESTDWKREMLCEHISDPTRLLIPEFDRKIHVRDSYERPEFYIPVVVADGGYIDYFACLYGYVDFVHQKLIVEDSIIEKRLNLGQIHQKTRKLAEDLYAEPMVDECGNMKMGFKVNPRRHADMKPVELAELDEVYHWPFVAADNHDPDSQIAALRDRMARNQIIILSKNEVLIRQLGNAIRDPKGKLTRSEEYGHWDAVMALVYMARVAPWNVNPRPKEELIDWSVKQTHRKPREIGQNVTRARLLGQLKRINDGNY